MAGWFNTQQIKRPIRRVDNPALPWSPLLPPSASMMGMISSPRLRAPLSAGGGGGGEGGGPTARYAPDDGKRIDAHVDGSTVALVNHGAQPYHGLNQLVGFQPQLPPGSAQGHQQLMTDAGNFQAVEQDTGMLAKGAPPQKIDPGTGFPAAEHGGNFGPGAVIVGDSSTGKPNPEVVVTTGPSKVVPVSDLPQLPPGLLPAVNKHQEEPGLVAYDGQGNIVGMGSGGPRAAEQQPGFQPLMPPGQMKYARPLPLTGSVEPTPGNPQGIIAGVTARPNLTPFEPMPPPDAGRSRESRAIWNLLRSGDARSVGTALQYEQSERAFQADEARRKASTQINWVDAPDGGKIAMTGSGGVAYTQRPEHNVSPEDIIEIPTKGGGSVMINRRTSQILDKQDQPFTEADMITLPTPSGGKVTINRRTGQAIERAEVPKTPYTAADFETVALGDNGGHAIINKRTGQPMATFKPGEAKDPKVIMVPKMMNGSSLPVNVPHVLKDGRLLELPTGPASAGGSGGASSAGGGGVRDASHYGDLAKGSKK